MQGPKTKFWGVVRVIRETFRKRFYGHHPKSN